MAETLRLHVNGKVHAVQVEPFVTLADFLREELGLTGVRISCNQGDCGACTVLLDGDPVNACLLLAVQADGRSVTTIEGLASADCLHPLQEAFIELHGMQCGFCTPGVILAAKALLDRNPDPSERDVKEALVGNICRCGSYPKIISAVRSAAQRRA